MAFGRKQLESQYSTTNHDEFSKSEKGIAANTQPLEAEDVPWTFKRVVAIISLCLVYVGSQVILYFISAGLTPISKDLNTSTGNWMVTANTLAVASLVPFVGYMTDLLGRRWIAIMGSVMLIVASAIMGTAHGLAQAIVAQTLGGAGAAICELTAVAGVAEITPARWRGVALSAVTFSIVFFMPQVLYFILIEKYSTWRYCFLLCGLWNLVGVVGLFFCYHPPPRHNTENLTKKDILARIDYVGAFLSIGGVTLFLVGLQAGGYTHPWTSGITLGPLISGGLMLVAFCVWEAYGWHKYPMVPKVIFHGLGGRVIAIALVLVFVAGMDFYSILGFFPIVLENVFNTSNITVGVRALCYPLTILGGACILSTAMSYSKGHVREMFFFCSAIMTAFTGALAWSNPDRTAATLAFASLSGFGNGAVVVSALTLALYASPDHHIGTTGGLSLAVRFLGGSVGTSVYFNVFNTQITKNLPAITGRYAVGAGLPAENVVPFLTALLGPDPTSVATISGVTPQILAAAKLGTQWAFAESLKWVWITTIPFGVISCIVCLFLPNIREFMTRRVAVDIH